MKYLECKTIIKYSNLSAPLLTYTSAMDCWSFSLPAGKEGSCPHMIDEPNSICTGCYAMINRYNMPVVVNAQWTRFLWTKYLLEHKHGGFKEFVSVMIDSIKKHATNGFFRWMDSGDLFSPLFIRACYAICSNLPDIQHWFPTRVWYIKSKSIQSALKQLASLPNVTIRPSAIHYDEIPPNIPYLAQGTTVLTNKYFQVPGILECPKSINHSSCEQEKCRLCWTHKMYRIGYRYHGYIGSDKVSCVTPKIKQKRANIALTYNGKLLGV